MIANTSSEIDTILVTGATGYVGGRLIPRLLDAGYRVRALVRGDADRLHGRPWSDRIEVAVGDVMEPDSLSPALDGVDAAYYLIHSMVDSEDFHERDRTAAHNFAAAAEDAGLQRIIYLGGLGGDDDNLSRHLASRHETGRILREYDTAVTEFRAAVVIGSGSASFEMMRHLAERVPILICPRWVFTRIQPISIRDILSYLTAALQTPASRGRIIEIGGADVVTYADMMKGYADERDLKRTIVPVPFLTPTLSSYWVHLVTPIPARIARPLIKGVRNEVVVTDNTAAELFPDMRPLSYKEALHAALRRMRDGDVRTIWNDSLVSSMGNEQPDTFTQEQGMFIERRERPVDAPPAVVFRAFAGIGGAHGWPYHRLWQLRGLLDRLVGGVGMRRGRRHPDDLRVGDALDFWRVEAIEPDARLLLRAEMKVPGRAWLEFCTYTAEDGRTHLRQTAFFDAKGLFGLLYWYTLIPLHSLIFPNMLNTIARRAEEMAGRLETISAD